MKIADANIYLRYLINDNNELYQKAKSIIENNELYLPVKVICEIVYVLDKVYHVNRIEIRDTLVDLVQQPNITVSQIAAMVCSMDL